MVSPLLLLGCTQPSLPDGHWLMGDLHVHSSVGSNDTDGLGTPDALGPAMEAAGLDFLFLTDHSNSAGSMDCDDVEDCPNQGPEISDEDWPQGVFPGSEISPVWSLDEPDVPTGHVGCLALNGLNFSVETFIDRPVGTITGGDAVEQCLEADGWAIVNHPFALAPWIEYDWTSDDFHAIEVYNGGARFDAWDAKGLSAWEERVGQGYSLVPVGGSDCHEWSTDAPGELLTPAMGWPTTRVYVHEGESVLDALTRGRVVVAEPGTELSLVAISDRNAVGPGEHIEEPAEVQVHAKSVETDLRLQLVEIGGAVIAEATMEDGEAVLSLNLTQGIYYARVWPTADTITFHGGVGITAALYVD